jgi:hypothetical protein
VSGGHGQSVSVVAICTVVGGAAEVLGNAVVVDPARVDGARAPSDVVPFPVSSAVPPSPPAQATSTRQQPTTDARTPMRDVRTPARGTAAIRAAGSLPPPVP